MLIRPSTKKHRTNVPMQDRQTHLQSACIYNTPLLATRLTRIHINNLLGCCAMKTSYFELTFRIILFYPPFLYSFCIFLPLSFFPCFYFPNIMPKVEINFSHVWQERAFPHKCQIWHWINRIQTFKLHSIKFLLFSFLTVSALNNFRLLKVSF